MILLKIDILNKDGSLIRTFTNDVGKKEISVQRKTCFK